MKRSLPPFAAVRAFEAAARHNSFSRAADELCLSPSAISHQVRNLEEYLATKLFDRRGGALALTHVGEDYLVRLTTLLGDLDDATRFAMGKEKTDLRILSTPGFAARWLVPRLSCFEHAGKVRLRVSTGAPDTDFSHNQADIVVMWGMDPIPGVVHYPLMTTTRYPVASPELVQREGIRAPRDLLRQNLIRDEVDDQWAEWLRASGVNDVEDLPETTVYPNCEYATVAAEQGNGVALAYDAVVRRTVEKGSLVRLFTEVTTPRTIYSVAVREGTQNDPLIHASIDWLLSCAAADGDLPQFAGRVLRPTG